jgi:hypothetical protein
VKYGVKNNICFFNNILYTSNYILNYMVVKKFEKWSRSRAMEQFVRNAS